MSILKVSIRQLKAARSLLGWSQEDLAMHSGVSIPTIKRLEAEGGELGGRTHTGKKIIDAFQSAGMEFINGGQPGVRMCKKPESAAELTHRIDVIEDDLAQTDRSSEQTPAGGMERLERARKREAVTKLKNRRTRLRNTKK